MGKEKAQPNTIDDFYYHVQSNVNECSKAVKMCYITSRSTEESILNIENICDRLKNVCQHCLIPTDGVFLRKTNLSIKAYKFFICNTKFKCQSLLADDTGNGHLVDFHPPYSKYLFVELVWHLNYESILAESILYFPLDLCVEILEILPRCIDLLDSQRATKFLSTIIPNAYKKLILLRDAGSQTKDIEESTKLLAGNIQELITQFTNERFLKFKDMPKMDQYKRHGTLLKTIIQMVQTCFTSKLKNVELECELEKMYKLTFGWEPIHKIEDSLLQKYLTEIDRELMNLLLKKVKEIDCNIYLNWTEYDDEENTSLTLQRAIGLECYFFIENTKEFKDTNNKEYEHLIECLSQLASKPDPENHVDSMQLTDLCRAVKEGRKDCLKALLHRYKEWNDFVIDSIDSHINLLDKDDCLDLFEYLSKELNKSSDISTSENLQTYILFLAKALIFLDITDLYEIVIKSILQFHEDDNLENYIDISNFERFIVLNPNFSTAKNLRVVLFFLCLKTKFTMKILLKMAIGHSDYPDVAINLDDLSLLLPIMKIQTESKYETLVDALRKKCSEVKAVNPFLITDRERSVELHPKTITLVIRILQEICLDGGEWNSKKFSELVYFLHDFCEDSEIIHQVIIPFLWSSSCTLTHLRTVISILQHFKGFHLNCRGELISVIEYHAVNLLDNIKISRYIIDEIVSQLLDITRFKECGYFNQNLNKSITYANFVSPFEERLEYGHLSTQSSYQCKIRELGMISKSGIRLIFDDFLRFIYLKCTKKLYLEYAAELFKTHGKLIKCGLNNHEIMDRIIRITFETCLLCLEFPEIAAPDTISFLFRCLYELLITVLKDSSKNFRKSIGLSFNTHHKILGISIDKTVLAESYNKLFKDEDAIENRLKAMELFAQECIVNSDEISEFQNPKSTMAIKFWCAYDLFKMLSSEDIVAEEFIKRVEQYFKSDN